MVSIIDRARLGNLNDFAQKQRQKNKNSQNLAKYFKQREEEAILQAEKNGYFLNLTRTFIEENFAPEYDVAEDDDDRSSVDKFLKGKATYRDVSQVYFIHLPKSHVRNLGEINLCQNLTVLLMPNNFITNFDVLINCLNLTKLDLHGNQISSLPQLAFWSSLVFLQFLHLHDNPIGDINAIHSLAGCQSLVVLTIYDTPLSLKRNYRHHVVNTIWCLKALDHHVVSDEEIIEDANFTGRFATMATDFQLDLCPEPKETSSLETEIKTCHGILLSIDQILAHNSPVLIIQRFYRGHRVRKNNSFSAPKLSSRKSRSTTKTTPDLPGQTSNTTFPAIGEPVKVPSKTIDLSEEDTMGIDFDLYMSHVRPGSSNQVTGRSDAATQSARSIPRNFRIDLNKLKNIEENLEKDKQKKDTQTRKEGGLTLKKSKTEIDNSKKSSPKFKRIKDIRHFFGKMVRDLPSPTPQEEYVEDTEDLPEVRFRLKGLKVDPVPADPTFDMIMARREAGHEVRLAEADYHRHSDLAPRPTIQKRKKMNNEQRYFTKTQGTMGLACLQAVQQAYKDRDKAERRVATTSYVTDLRQQRNEGKSRVNIYKEERRNAILRERDSERRRLADAMEQKEYLHMEEIDRMQERRYKQLQFARQRKNELTFVSDFNTQITSVSKALMKENNKRQRERELTDMSGYILDHKMTNQESHAIVKKFMEHRRIMRQTESAIARAALDTKMLEDANDRLLAAKTRVASLRARHEPQREHGFPSIHSPTPLVARQGIDGAFNAIIT